MSTVFVLGAGASIGAKPGGRTKFPGTNELVERIREIVCEREDSYLPALALYLARFAPVRDITLKAGRLHADWDRTNVEELYAAIEFESRITDHLMLASGDRGSGTQFFQEYFSGPYRDAVTQLLRGPYQDWMRACYSASYGSEPFPHLHENFLRIVKMELLDAIAHTLGVLSEEEDTSNFSRLARHFEKGDTVITFNYDLLVEQHLTRERPADWSYLTGYGFRPTSEKCDLRFAGDAPNHPSTFKVLKLHGSSNWHFRFVQGTGDGPPGFVEGYRTVPEPIGVGNRIRDVRPAFFQATDNFFKRVVVEGEPGGYYERFMIPPSTYKAEYNFSAQFLHDPTGSPLPLGSSTMWLPQLLYRLALQALAAAERIVFIGFSMAPADTSIRMLFRAAADANSALRLVEIADPCANVASRIKAVLPRAQSYKRVRSFGELLDEWKV
ncbi:MAG: SIR2 family protein [Candidatus Rokubacteria bacterium]|nr:SIR2 family protein [Candidatus Rokubacteria bacterium]